MNILEILGIVLLSLIVIPIVILILIGLFQVFYIAIKFIIVLCYEIYYYSLYSENERIKNKENHDWTIDFLSSSRKEIYIRNIKEQQKLHEELTTIKTLIKEMNANEKKS